MIQHHITDYKGYRLFVIFCDDKTNLPSVKYSAPEDCEAIVSCYPNHENLWNIKIVNYHLDYEFILQLIDDVSGYIFNLNKARELYSFFVEDIEVFLNKILPSTIDLDKFMCGYQ